MKIFLVYILLVSIFFVKCLSNNKKVITFTERGYFEYVISDSMVLLETDNFLPISGKMAFDLVEISGLQKMDSYSNAFDDAIKILNAKNGEMLFEIKSNAIKKLRDGRGRLCDFIIDTSSIYVLFSSPAEIYEYNINGELLGSRRLYLPEGIEVHHESPAFYRIKNEGKELQIGK